MENEKEYSSKGHTSHVCRKEVGGKKMQLEPEKARDLSRAQLSPRGAELGRN